jgi:chromosome segregation ATPase
MKNGDFSNHLIDTISLQIKAGGATDDSISLLVQIRNTLESNRDQDQAEFNVLKTQLNDLIQTLTDKANAALNEVADANSRLNDLISTRGTLEQEIPRLDGQVTTLHKKIVKLQDDRAHDVNDYHSRVGEQREVINVVQEIINTLTDRVLNGGDLELIEKQKLTDKLQNLKYSNPILALVDLTATFDRNLAVEIIQRLEALRDSLKAAVEDEEQAEEQAGLNYDALYAELNRVVDKLTQDLQQDKRDYEQVLNDVTTQTNRRDNNQQIYDASNQQKDDTVLQLQSETDNFNARRTKISQEIDLIQQAQNLLVANAPNFRKFD